VTRSFPKPGFSEEIEMDRIENFRAMAEALEGMLADERRLLRWVRTAVDDSMTYCAFCDASHPDEAKIEHRDGCAVLLAETTLARVRGEL